MEALVNCLVGLSLPWKSVVRLSDRLDMTIVVDWDIKPQTKQTNCPVKRFIEHTHTYIDCLSDFRIEAETWNLIGNRFNIWARSRENLSSEFCDQVRLKPVCSATEAS